MRIRILTSRGGHACGAEVDAPDEAAIAWIGVGDAERIAETDEPEPDAVPLAGSEKPLETAMKAKAKGR